MREKDLFKALIFLDTNIRNNKNTSNYNNHIFIINIYIIIYIFYKNKYLII